MSAPKRIQEAIDSLSRCVLEEVADLFRQVDDEKTEHASSTSFSPRPTGTINVGPQKA
jgi:hypothetical protein